MSLIKFYHKSICDKCGQGELSTPLWELKVLPTAGDIWLQLKCDNPKCGYVGDIVIHVDIQPTTIDKFTSDFAEKVIRYLDEWCVIKTVIYSLVLKASLK